jgi:hypothetical protein
MERLKAGLPLLLASCCVPMLAAVSWLIALFKHGILFRNALAVDRKGLKAGVVTYVRPEDEKTVTLVGVMHVADHEFFAEHRRRTDEAEKDGAIILYEKTRDTGPPLQDDDHSPEACIERRMEGLSDQYRFLASSTGRAYQTDEFAPKPSWINTDMSLREMAKFMARSWFIRQIVQLLDHAERKKAETESMLNDLRKTAGREAEAPEPADGLYYPSMFTVDLQMRLMVINKLMFFPFKFISWRPQIVKTLLVQRNMVGYRGIMDALDNFRDVVSIWGAGHLPGIGELLEKEGFFCTSVEWVYCNRFRRYGIRDTLRWIRTGENPDHAPLDTDRRKPGPLKRPLGLFLC